MPGDGYNIFVLGAPGSGRHRIARELLDAESRSGQRPDDWVYVNRFDDTQRPNAMRLPPGKGKALREDMSRLVEELSAAIPAAFESDEYRNRLAEIQQEFEERQQQAIHALQREASAHHVALLHTPQGYALAPLKDGKPIDEEEFQKLSEDEKREARETIERLGKVLKSLIEQAPRWQKEQREKVRELDRDVTMSAVGVQIEELTRKWTEHPEVVNYVRSVEKDVLEHAQEFRKPEDMGPLTFLPKPDSRPSFRRYEVNLLVDHSETDGAPVVYESNPTFQNLLGRVEHVSEFGALVTDFRMIRAGSLHRANGGYLLIDADRVLSNAYSWEGLKRALVAREIRIESLGQMLSLVSTVSLEPESIPLDVKVVLFGSRRLYYLLCLYESDFGDLFKVAADFEDEVRRDDDSTMLYARLIAALARRHGLSPFHRTAVARVIDECARLTGDAEKLSTHVRDISDVLRESDYWAREDGGNAVTAEHVRQALDGQERRLNRVQSRLYESIERGDLLIDTDGESVAQVNGLSVLQLGSYSFGQPSRITATVRLGAGEVVDIQREAELGGAIHSKGVLILSSYLGSRFSRALPLSLRASLVFEQTYGQVDGDSASLAELCALLSALSNVPIRQFLAVTGAVNQLGSVQVIGGVNQKIEGFFAICERRGLTGKQGVLIPKGNVKHLMLRQKVVEAAESGRFHIYAVETVDGAMSLLTGMPPGERGDGGQFPSDTVNRRVDDSLKELASIRRAFVKTVPGEGSSSGGAPSA